MKYSKTFEEMITSNEVNLVEFVAPTREHPSYKNEVRKKKRKKLGEIEPIAVPPNHTKDIISFKGKP